MTKLTENMNKSGVPMTPMVQAIMNRKDIFAFRQEEIPEEIMEAIVKAGYYAPSGHNMQTWKFTVVRGGAVIESLLAVITAIAEKRRLDFCCPINPACLILVSNDLRNPYGCQDASCAAENMVLAAYSYGIGSMMTGILMTLKDEAAVKAQMDELHIPGNHVVWDMIALGYPKAAGKQSVNREDVVKFIS